jgi:hypothetical protein
MCAAAWVCSSFARSFFEFVLPCRDAASASEKVIWGIPGTFIFSPEMLAMGSMANCNHFPDSNPQKPIEPDRISIYATTASQLR